MRRARRGGFAGPVATAPATSARRRQADGRPARGAPRSLHRTRKGKARASRFWRPHAERDGRKGVDRRETRQCRGKRMCRPSLDINSECAWVRVADVTALSVPICSIIAYARGHQRFHVSRYVVLHLATLVVLVPADFL